MSGEGFDDNINTHSSNTHSDLFVGDRDSRNSINPTPVKTASLNLFFGNITSLSNHAKGYIYSLPPEIHLIGLAEVHKEDSSEVISAFRTNGFTVSYSAPEISSGTGNHGGELVGARSHLSCVPVQSEILNAIVSHFQAPLRLAARILHLKGCDVTVVSLYLRCSVGLDYENNIRLRQIHMLVQILGLPVIAVGDFNITVQDFQDSGWPELLKVKVLHTGARTTLATHSDRPIDFGLISNSISEMYIDSRILTNVPFGPHFGLLFSFYASPRSIHGKVLCVPKALPLKDFPLIGPS